MDPHGHTRHQGGHDDNTSGSPPPTSRQNEDDNPTGSRNNSPEQQRHQSDNEDEFRGQQEEVTFEPVDPENFDTKSFFSTVDALSVKLHSDSLHSFDNNFDAQELNSMVSSVTVSMENFKNYTMHSQAHLEKLREQIKEVKDRMYRKMSQNPYDPKADQRVSCEQRDMDAKLQHLNKELAKASEELVRAQQASAETEEAAVKAALLAEQSAQEAREIQEEYESRRQKEAETRKREEERRALEERMIQEQERKEQENRKAEEGRRANLRKDESATKADIWEDWPMFTYRVDSGDFAQGIGCMVRGNTANFRENMISVDVVDPLDSDFCLAENEELVSHIINIRGDSDLQHPSVILIPHCTSRASAMSREPVIKMETPEGWVELKGHEVLLETHKDLKLVQAEFTKMTKMVVVTRYKRDFLTFNKRGGTVHSNVDQRVSFIAPRGCFQHKENFVFQIQPVDSSTISEIRFKTQEGTNLLATSAIMAMDWTSKEFQTPVTFNIPVPPNPAKAKKAAAMRAAKEAKMKNQNQPPPPADEEELKRKKERARKTGKSRASHMGGQDEEEDTSTKKPTRWYMGQYGINEEDENDVVYLAYKCKKGKWHLDERTVITQIRIDLVQFDMENPSLVEKFVVLRMKPDTEPEDGLEVAKLIEKRLTERIVNVILKQRSDNCYEVAVDITLHTKAESVLKQLEEQGYDEGPGISKEIILKEGDHIGLDFRANIQATDEHAKLDLIFNSQLPNRLTFEISEVNKFLQKSYHVYRGFVQVCRKEATTIEPKKNKKNKKESDSIAEDDTEAEDKQTVQYNKCLVLEHLVSIPKEQEQLEPPTLSKAPVVLRNREDCISSDTLRQVAGEMGDEWQRIASYLGVKRMRIQAILRNNQARNSGEDEVKYDMLMTWAKRVPKSMSKVEVLSNALIKGGREDLATDLRDMEKNFQRERKGLH